MLYLICYDITNNSLRANFARKIIACGLDRINKSVYLGMIKETPLNNLEAELSKLLKLRGQPQDSLIILPLLARQVQDMRIYGRNDLDKDELSGEKSTLIL